TCALPISGTFSSASLPLSNVRALAASQALTTGLESFFSQSSTCTVAPGSMSGPFGRRKGARVLFFTNFLTISMVLQVGLLRKWPGLPPAYFPPLRCRLRNGLLLAGECQDRRCGRHPEHPTEAAPTARQAGSGAAWGYAS